MNCLHESLLNAYGLVVVRMTDTTLAASKYQEYATVQRELHAAILELMSKENTV
jgi:hypothetical protein